MYLTPGDLALQLQAFEAEGSDNKHCHNAHTEILYHVINAVTFGSMHMRELWEVNDIIIFVCALWQCLLLDPELGTFHQLSCMKEHRAYSIDSEC